MSDVVHVDKIEARETFQESLDKACLEDKWAAAVWSVKEDGTVVLNVTTNQFPFLVMDVSVDMLKKDFDKKRFPPTPEPLPVADFLTRVFHPRDNLEKQ